MSLNSKGDDLIEVCCFDGVQLGAHLQHHTLLVLQRLCGWLDSGHVGWVRSREFIQLGRYLPYVLPMNNEHAQPNLKDKENENEPSNENATILIPT